MSVKTERAAWTLSARGIALLVALVAAVIALLLTGAAVLVHRDLQQQFEQRALAIARAVAEQPGLADEVVTGRPSATGPVQAEAERVRAATDALYVVITDRDGIRFSHTDPQQIGKPVSTSPRAALAGNEVAAVERGTLGESARGKVPLRDAAGTVVGEVSVGIPMADVKKHTAGLLLTLGAVAVATLFVGAAGAAALGRGLRRSTLGLQPREMANLLREHAAVLGGIRDGILAVDADGRITVVNAEAERLLGAHPARGTLLEDAALPAVAAELLRQELVPEGIVCVVADRVLIVNRVDVERDGRDLGRVLILRDRSDLDAAARELEATRALTDALRAQTHEYRNRLHALGGMLHMGHLEAATDYLEDLGFATTWVPGVDDPYLAGLLAAKAAVASEAGVELEVMSSSFLNGTVAAPLDAVTVLGNLLDNAIRAAASGRRRPARVEVVVLSDGADLLFHVADSGDGIDPGLGEDIFSANVTTRRDGSGLHGIGLTLARHTARRHGGDVTLVDDGRGESMTAFEARLAAVIRTSAAAGWHGQPA